MLVRVLPARGASLRRLRPASPAITLASPVSPQAPGVPLLVSGTYAGQPGRISVVWRQGGLDVGTPVDAAVIGGGAWSATLVTPATAGTYTLRAAFDGTTPTADSAPILIEAAQPGTLGSFGFEGTGAPADTIALFGHAFEQGTLQPTDPVVLRSGGSTLHRTQINVLSTWGDGSVKTALMAAELPALADTQILTAELRSGQSHPDPGSALSFAAALSGRSAAIRLYAPGNPSTPVWSFDPIAALGTDRWHEGPLALSSRAETVVPASACGVESVRLVVDVIVTRDGILEIDACFSNDRLPFETADRTGGGYANCGIATFGYVIEIDGTVVYDQRPATGPATQLLQYSQWIRRRGRAGNGTVYGVANNRPLFRPDLDLLVRAGVHRDMLRERLLTSGAVTAINNIWNAGQGKETDPYWTWGLNRSAGAVGGRPELGYRTLPGAAWIAFGDRLGQLISQRMFEAASTRPMYFFDWEEGYKRWINPLDWPRFSTAVHSGTAGLIAPSPRGTPRSLATGLPAAPTHNITDYITIDHAHHGAFYWPVALLGGRRLAYDGLAARAAWATMDRNQRWNNGTALFSDTPTWRGVPADHTTGIAWGPRLGSGQTRAVSWDFRDIVDAAAILPDSYPNRAFYNQNVLAWVNGFVNQIPNFQARHGSAIGMPFPHADSGQGPNYMLNMGLPGLLVCQKLGLGGPNFARLFNEHARYRVGWVSEPSFNHRLFIRGSSFFLSGDPQPPAHATRWTEAQAKTIAAIGDTSADWTANPGTRGYHKDAIMVLANLAYDADLPVDLKAMAADALVLCRSERQFANGVPNDNPASDPWPTIQANRFYDDNYSNNSAFMPPGISAEWDRAPTIPAGQSFDVSSDAANGTIIGVVRVTGTLPRNSAAGRGVADAFVIAAQPAGNPFAISAGGALRLVNRAALGAAPVAVQVYCRTWEGNSPVEHRSATVAVTVNPVTIAPTLKVNDGSWSVPANATPGSTVGTLEFEGTGPITVTEVSGDTAGLFTLDTSTTPHTVRVGASLAAFAGTAYTVLFRASGPTAADERQVVISVTDPVQPPAIANQTLTIAEGVPLGTDTAPTLVNTGGPASALAITAGDPDKRFAAVAPNLIRAAGRLARIERASYALTVRAQNAVGESSAAITVTLTPAPWVYAIPNTQVLFAASASRRLRGNYAGPLLRAYREADGEEEDIGADDAGLLDVGALAAFAGGGLVAAALYDQSPMEQGLATAHTGGLPYLTTTTGAMRSLGPNSRPALRFEGGRGLRVPALRTGGLAEVALVMAARRDFDDTATRTLAALGESATANPTVGNTSLLLRRDTVSNRLQLYRSGTGSVVNSASNSLINGTQAILGAYTLNQANRRRAVSIGGTFSNAADTAAWPAMSAAAHLVIGGRPDVANLDWIGEIAEVLVTGAFDLAADQPAVQANMAAFFGV